MKTLTKFYFMMIVVFIIYASIATVFADTADIPMSIYVNDERVVFDETKPYIDVNSRTQVPVCFLTEKLGADVSWNGDLFRVTIKKDDLNVILDIDKKEAFVNGKSKMMDTKAVIQNARTVVPLRFVSESFGFDVDYEYAKDIRFDGKERHVIDIVGNIDTVNTGEPYDNLYNLEVTKVPEDLVNLQVYKPTPEDLYEKGYSFYVDAKYDVTDQAPYFWDESGANTLIGKGSSMGYAEGLEALNDIFLKEGEKIIANSIEAGKNDPDYVIIAEAAPYLVNYGPYGGGIGSPGYKMVEENGRTYGYFADNGGSSFWGFSRISYDDDSQVKHPRISASHWYNYLPDTTSEMNPRVARDLNAMKPLIRMYSESDRDAKMFFRMYDKAIRGLSYERYRDAEYTDIYNFLVKAENGILEFPDGTLVKLVADSNNTFIFMNVAFEK